MDNKTIRHFGKNTLNEFLEELKERVVDKLHELEKALPKKLSDLENDLEMATTWDDLKDKPFGDEYVWYTMLQDYTLEFTSLDDSGFAKNFIYNGELQYYSNLIIGKTYKVIWDGAIYELECFESNTFPTLGNQQESTGDYPFSIWFEDWKLFVQTNDTSNHILGLEVRATETTCIDKKWLPESVTNVCVKITVPDSFPESIGNLEPDEPIYQHTIRNAMMDGRQVTVILHTDYDLYDYSARGNCWFLYPHWADDQFDIPTGGVHFRDIANKYDLEVRYDSDFTLQILD